MSLILEALRKSEAERQREGAPNVAMELPPVPVRGGSSTPAWVWPTLAVVVVGAVLAGWLGMRAGQHDRTANATTELAATAAPAVAGPAQAAPTAARSAPAAAREPAPAPLLTELPAATAPAPPAPAPLPAPPQPAPTNATSAAAPPPLAVAPAAPARPLPPPSAPASLPDDLDAPPISATGLPAVKLSMHMWDADPARRFVILDGQRMGEGDRNGGLQVIAIRRDGVIIERSGIRARVSLP